MVNIDDRGVAEFRLYLPEARRVQIVGHVPIWGEGPIEMLKDPGGWWRARVDLAPGDHEFQYLVNERVWLADYAASGVRRGRYGEWISLLYVPETCEDAQTLPEQNMRLAA